jgi:hypothetical protein
MISGKMRLPSDNPRSNVLKIDKVRQNGTAGQTRNSTMMTREIWFSDFALDLLEIR